MKTCKFESVADFFDLYLKQRAKGNLFINNREGTVNYYACNSDFGFTKFETDDFYDCVCELTTEVIKLTRDHHFGICCIDGSYVGLTLLDD